MFDRLRKHWASITIATLAAIAGGLFSSAIAVTVGPALGLLMGDSGAPIPWAQLVGPNLAGLVGSISGSASVAASELWRLLPYALFFLATAKTSLTVLQWYLWERLSEVVAKDLRSELVDSYLNLDPHERSRNDGAIDRVFSSTAVNDVRVAREYVVKVYGGIPRMSIEVVFYLITLLLLSPSFLLLLFVCVFPMVILVRRIGKRIRGRAGKALDQFAELANWLQSRLLGIETIKQFRTEKLEIFNMRELNESLFEKFFRTARVKARTAPIMEAFAMLSVAIVLLVSIYAISRGWTTAQVQLSFFTTLGILSQSAGRLGKYYNSSREGAAAIARIDELKKNLATNRRTDVSPRSESVPDVAVKMSKVRVVYPDGRVGLEEASYDFRSGVFYALKGPSGSGKSSLVKAILGLVRPQSGEVVLGTEGGDGLGYLPQRVELAPTSLSRNVTYPELDENQSRIRETLARVKLQDLRTSQLEDPRGLSGGEKQRVLLARLLYRSDSVVIVDEGTSALDPNLESQILDALRELARKGAAVIMVAHRQSSIDAADVVVELSEGRIVGVDA